MKRLFIVMIALLVSSCGPAPTPGPPLVAERRLHRLDLTLGVSPLGALSVEGLPQGRGLSTGLLLRVSDPEGWPDPDAPPPTIAWLETGLATLEDPAPLRVLYQLPGQALRPGLRLEASRAERIPRAPLRRRRIDGGWWTSFGQLLWVSGAFAGVPDHCKDDLSAVKLNLATVRMPSR